MEMLEAAPTAAPPAARFQERQCGKGKTEREARVSGDSQDGASDTSS